MGIIKRQSIKRSIVSYVGTLIGVISTILIYPLDEEVYGFIQWLIAVATFIFPFASLGGTVLAIRFFRDFKHEKGNNGFLGFLLLWLLFAFSLFSIVAYIFQEELFQFLIKLKFKPYFEENSLAILILCLLIILIQLLIAYTSNFNRIVIPNALFNLGIKMGIPILVLLYVFRGLTFVQIKWLLILLYALIVVGLIIYLIQLKGFNLRVNFNKVFERKQFGEMFNYAMFGIFGSIGAVLAFSIDTVMVSPLTDFSQGGVYSIALFIGNAISIPLAAINGIANPVISTAWGKNDTEEIAQIYKRASKLLFTSGLFILVLVWLSLDDVFQLTSKYETLKAGVNVVLIIGVARVIDMATGVNGGIIGFSKYYRFNLLAMLVLSFSNIYINFQLIPIYQITGAAIATGISIVLFNLIKYVFIWVKFKMQPFDFSFLIILALGFTSYFLTSFVPTTAIPFINLIIKSGLASLLFVIPLLYFRLVPDINDAVEPILKRIFGRSK